MNQDINISENNRVLRPGKGRLGIGNQSVDVSGENNSVVISAGGSLHIGSPTRPPKVCRGQVWAHNVLARGQHAQKPPKVRRGQVWAHNVLARRYQVMSGEGVRDGR